MRQQMNTFRLTPIAACFLATGTVMGMAHAGTIDSVNQINIGADESASGDFFAEVYQDITTDPPSDTNGFIDFESTNHPGIEVYDEANPMGGSQGGEFDGCIMSKLDAGDTDGDGIDDNCTAASDSSKRIKVNATETSTAPTLPTADGIDLVFGTLNTDVTEHSYRWFGKLGNQTDGRLTGFKVEIGTGVGMSFTESSSGISDGLSIATISGPFGNFPGGLFGGSQTSDTPFFSDQDADFIPTASSEISIESTAVPNT